MKKLLLLFTLIVGTYSFAQKIHVGPEVGMNLLKVETTNFGREYQPGWYAGATFEYDFFDWMSIKSGVFYSQKKQSSEAYDTVPLVIFGFDPQTIGLGDIDFNTYSKTESRYNEHFVEIPLMANFKWEGINVGIGGYCSYLFKSRLSEITISQSPFMQFIDLSTLDPSGQLGAILPDPYQELITGVSNPSILRRFDAGFKASIGYQYDQVGFHAAYQYGMMDYRTSDISSPIQRHQFFQFSVNYLFGLGKGKDNQPRVD
jgi:Outer membrane protein beta-barrel domain